MLKRNLNTHFSYILLTIFIGIITLTQITFAPVFALERSSSGLPTHSGQILIDNDPDGGYQGDYVLIYNNSSNPNSRESTGTLSNISTTAEGRRTRSATAGSEQLEYHPESISLDRSFDFAQFNTNRASYNKNDIKSFTVSNIQTGQRKQMEFRVLYSGTHCYVWVPAHSGSFNVRSFSKDYNSSYDNTTEDNSHDSNYDGEDGYDAPYDESDYDNYSPSDYDGEDGYDAPYDENEAVSRSINQTLQINEENNEESSIAPNYAVRAADAEANYPVSEQMAEDAGREFDSAYQQMTDNFGQPLNPDGSGKVSLLLYDIQDGNNPSAYVGGFFDSSDLYASSNNTAMLHIDTYPSIYSPYGVPGKISKCYSTIIHEFQHLLNYSRYFQNAENGEPGAAPMDSWLNEAMSMAAEEMIFPESSIPMRASYYNSDPRSAIRNGKSLLSFDNSLESYSLSALFASYLNAQTGSYNIFSSILDNYVSSEAQAIEQSVAGTALDGMSFGDILAAYRIAAAVNDSTGLYGFQESPLLSNLSILNFTGEGRSLQLPGGGSIIVKTKNGVFEPGNGAGANIKFVGIRISENGVAITKKPENLTMLVGQTFNLTATAMADGIERHDIVWTSSDPAIADGSGGRPGVWPITALTAGTTEITAECNGYVDTFTLEVLSVPDPSSFEGITINQTEKTIHILSTEGMYSFARLVNNIPPAGMPVGLAGYKIFLDTTVTLDDWTPVGTSAKPFNGTFYGNGSKIILNSLISESFTDAGVFGVNGIDGILEAVNVDLRGTITGTHAAAVAATNKGTISNAIVNVDQGAAIKSQVAGDSAAGGICADNHKTIRNSYVTNYGTIGSNNSERAGGVAGRSGDNNGTMKALIDGATVFNYGLITSKDDTGAVVGLLNGHGGGVTKVKGNINVYIAKDAKVSSTAGGSASVGGVIGYALQLSGGSSSIENANITVRLCGEVRSVTGQGTSGGVIGQSGVIDQSGSNEPIKRSVTLIVTLDPEFRVYEAQSTGLISGDEITPTVGKWIYAVPYDTTAKAMPGTTYNSQIKKIEYPKEGHPAQTIKVGSDTNNPMVWPQSNPTGQEIFNPIQAITFLTALSASDADLFDLNTASQTLCSEAKAAPNYFDFLLEADGLQITIPAYLDLDNEEIPEMTFDITGSHVQPTITEAESDPAGLRETVTVSCTNGRISDEEWSLKREENGVFIDYKSHQHISTDTLTKKEFTLNEYGLYEISATASAIYDNAKQNLTKYVLLSDQDILINGAGLTRTPTEVWTNLKDLTQQFTRSNGSSDPVYGQIPTVEIVQIKSVHTSIEEDQFKKESVQYPADMDAETVNHIGEPLERQYLLYETGRYRITAKGVNVPQEAVKYINIDVDAPMPSTLKDVTGKIINADTPYEVVLPIENHTQSPIHAEYSINEGGFAPLTEVTVSVPAGTKTLDIKTVDAATNESILTRYTLEQPATSSSGSSKRRKTTTTAEGLPYYYKNHNDKTTPKIFIGIADKIDGKMTYIAPPDKTVLFQWNPKNFKDIQGHWAKSNIDFVTEREIFVGTDPDIFSPEENMTRGMFAAIIGRLYERSFQTVIKGTDCPFVDVPKDYYYTDYITWAANAKILLGEEDNCFAPERDISREEMAAIMYRFANFLELSRDTSKTQLKYADTDSISPWFIESSKYCQETKLIEGRGADRFEPAEMAKRSEVTAVIQRFIHELLVQYD